MTYAGISIYLILLTFILGGLLVFSVSYLIHQKASFQFRSLSNLLEAMVQGDYSLRARGNGSEGALNELVVAINGLAFRLSEQRLASVESQFLLRTVIEHIDVAIIALDDSNQIQFTNPAAQKLLPIKDDANINLIDQLADISSIASGEQKVIALSLGIQKGRFNIHVEHFRSKGQQHKLLFITDVRTLLRSEERKAWQSLVRVISHEINNSLTPIASLSQTLHKLVLSQSFDVNITEDLTQGLQLIRERATGLGQFIQSYQQLTRLPPPCKTMVSLSSLLDQVCALFPAELVSCDCSPDLEISVDPVQFEQVLINLIKNAQESMPNQDADRSISITVQVEQGVVVIAICDRGCGIANPDNLFIPFYSTKVNGSGIGLVLCRQIIEAHHGSLSLNNRQDGPGSCAKIELPLGQTV